jgi:SPOR domain
MTDDQIQRTYRASQPPVRNAPTAASATPTANDPLAELARLIGQNDPFAEYGRDGGQRAAAMQAGVSAENAQAPAYDLDAAAAPAYAGEGYAGVPSYADEHYAAQSAQVAPFPPPAAPPPRSHYDADAGYGDAGYASDAYAQGVIPGHADEAAQSGYEQGPYYPNDPQSGAEQEHFYDDVPPRRRVGILAIAAVFALAVIGTAGAFGYRTLFGSSAPSGPPPVIKADATPSKIVPATDSKDPKSGKLIYDRVNNGQNEKLVSREEQPVGIKDKPVGAVLPQGQNGTAGGSMQQAALGSGVVGVAPKKIHTIAIHPNQAAAAPGRPPATAPAPTSTPTPTPAPTHARPAAPAPSSRAAANPAPRQVAHAEPPARHAAAPSNAPLSLNPNAPAPARMAQRTMRTAAVGTPTRITPARTAAPARIAPTRTSAPTRIAPTSAVSGGYAVQIASRHNEADAQASLHSLQAKYPQQLGGRHPLIRRVDLGAKGVYYRAMVGPFGSADEASKVCSSLKAAGGDCLVQRI